MYEEFKDAMDKIGSEVAEASKEHTYALLYSGGVDSTAILGSLLKNKANIYLIHMRYEKNEYYYIFLEQFALYMAMKYTLPLLFLSGFRNGFLDEYKEWKERGITHFVTGCGMDRMYQECYYGYPGTAKEYVPDINVYPKVLPFSKGERFRMFHPILDMFLGLKPRLYSIRQPKISMCDDWVSKWRDDEIRKLGLHVFVFDTHPLMLKIFDEYNPGLKDIVNRKDWTFRYVQDFFGKSYRDLCFDVMKSRRVSVELEVNKNG